MKQSGYLIWLPRLRKTVVAGHVLFDETWFPACFDKHVPNACTALPGNTASQSYHSDLSAADPPSPPTSLVAPSSPFIFPPLLLPGNITLPQPHGSVTQHVTSPILSPLPSSTHSNAPLTPLSQALFQNLQPTCNFGILEKCTLIEFAPGRDVSHACFTRPHADPGKGLSHIPANIPVHGDGELAESRHVVPREPMAERTLSRVGMRREILDFDLGGGEGGRSSSCNVASTLDLPALNKEGLLPAWQ